MRFGEIGRQLKRVAAIELAAPDAATAWDEVLTDIVVTAPLNRYLVLTRFTPRISYTFTRQSSSIPLYAFKRSRVEIGLTTIF